MQYRIIGDEPAGLRTFVATADSGGSAGHRSVACQQPAASRQIDALEAEFGVPLFQRVGAAAVDIGR